MYSKVVLASIFAALAVASPTPIAGKVDARAELEARQRGRVGSTANDLVNGNCGDVVMIFARGSTETGNMGTICGPPTANGLKENFNVAVQGVDYAAALNTNFLPGGADPAGVQEMTRLINMATTNCPNSKLVVGGYSQGAAVTHRAVEALPAAQISQIDAAFTFGDTQNQQDNGQINNFPPDKTNVICAAGDAVCRGTLTILPAHLSYGRRADEQVEFLTDMLQAAGAKLKRKL